MVKNANKALATLLHGRGDLREWLVLWQVSHTSPASRSSIPLTSFSGQMLYAAILIFDATLVLTHSRKVHIVEKVSRSLPHCGTRISTDVTSDDALAQICYRCRSFPINRENDQRSCEHSLFHVSSAIVPRCPHLVIYSLDRLGNDSIAERKSLRSSRDRYWSR